MEHTTPQTKRVTNMEQTTTQTKRVTNKVATQSVHNTRKLIENKSTGSTPKHSPFNLIKICSWGIMALSCFCILFGAIWTVQLPYIDIDVLAIPSWVSHIQVPPVWVKDVYLIGWMLFVLGIFGLIQHRYHTVAKTIEVNKTHAGIGLTLNVVGLIMVWLWIFFMFSFIMQNPNINVENMWFSHDGQILYDLGFVGAFGVLAFIAGGGLILHTTASINDSLVGQVKKVKWAGILISLIGFGGITFYYATGRFLESNDPLGSLRISNLFLNGGEILSCLGGLLLVIAYSNRRSRMIFNAGAIIVVGALLFSIILQAYTFASMDVSIYGAAGIENAWEYIQWDMNGTTLTHLQYAGFALIAVGFVLMMYSMYFGKITPDLQNRKVSLAHKALKTVCSVGGVMLIGTSTLATTSCQGYVNADGILVPKTLAIPTMTSLDGVWVPTTEVHEHSPYSDLFGGVDGLFIMKYTTQDKSTSIDILPTADSWISVFGFSSGTLPIFQDIHAFLMVFSLKPGAKLIPNSTHDLTVPWNANADGTVVASGNIKLHFKVFDLSWYPYP